MNARVIAELKKRLGQKSPLACPICGAIMIYRQNRTDQGFFLGCNRYPDCNYTMEIPESLKMQLIGYQQLPGF